MTYMHPAELLTNLVSKSVLLHSFVLEQAAIMP